MINEIRLDILGTSFAITAEEDETYLKEILAQYQAAVENTMSISGINDPLNVAILTGFLLCDEINKMKMLEDKSADAQEIENRTLNLIAELDRAFKNI